MSSKTTVFQEKLSIVFHHEIDLSSYLAAGLTAENLWAGLEEFAFYPHRFVETMDKSSCREIASDTVRRYERTLIFGKNRIEDVVQISRPILTTLIPAQKDIAASRFEIRMHEKTDGLSLSFSYAEVPVAGVTDIPQIQKLRQSAWQMKDRDVVRRILQRVCA